jgi:hypothetical protein
MLGGFTEGQRTNDGGRCMRSVHGGGGRRGAHIGGLLALLVFSLAWACLAVTPAMAEDGTAHIMGQVTDARTHAGISSEDDSDYSVFAAAYIADGPDWYWVNDSTTDASGNYDITGLPAGTYIVGFSEMLGSYRGQFFNGKATDVSADHVTVVDGAVTSGINAALEPGARITGTLTDASSGLAVNRHLMSIRTYAKNGSDWTLVDDSDAIIDGGYYNVGGLVAGTYHIEFVPESGYQSQFYNGSPTQATATDIVVGDGEVKEETNLVLVPLAKLPTSITIKTAATTTTRGKTVTLSGAVTPLGMIGTNIVVYVKKPGSSRWTYSSNRTTYALGGAAAWQYKYYFKPAMAKGTYTYKAVVPDSSTFIGSTSPTTVSIRLR